MPYCPRCGVEVDPSVHDCPLCSTPIPRFADLGMGEPAWPSSYDPDHPDPSKSYASSSERKVRALLGVAGMFSTAALAVVAADLFTTGGLTWSRYPLVSLAAGFGLIASALVWHHRPPILGTAWLVVTAMLLGCLDAADGVMSWFLALGLPLALGPFLLFWGGTMVFHRFRRRGYNVFGLVFSLVTVELGSIDGLVTLWASGRLGWSWSLVASLVLVPLAFLFFFLHFALHRTPDLRRTFHF